MYVAVLCHSTPSFHKSCACSILWQNTKVYELWCSRTRYNVGRAQSRDPTSCSRAPIRTLERVTLANHIARPLHVTHTVFWLAFASYSWHTAKQCSYNQEIVISYQTLFSYIKFDVVLVRNPESRLAMDIQLTSDEELDTIAASTQSATRWAHNRYSAWAEARNSASGPIDQVRQVPEDFSGIGKIQYYKSSTL